MLEISGAFATRWGEEWDLAARIEPGGSAYSKKRIIELFLDRMGPEIINVLLGRGTARYMFEVKPIPPPAGPPSSVNKEAQP